MKDRVPMYPGRVKLIPVAGQTNTFDLLRADGAVEVGTPLNKANLLKDSTTEALGLPSSAVPDDAFITLAHKTAPTLLAEFKTAGAYNWTVPAGVNKVLVAMIGGGGGAGVIITPKGSCPPYKGSTKFGPSATGGGSGEINVFEVEIASNTVCNLVVGAGGAKIGGAATSTDDSTQWYASQGGSTSFRCGSISKIAEGGRGGGLYPYCPIKNNAPHYWIGGSRGGQGSYAVLPFVQYKYEVDPPFGCVDIPLRQTYSDPSQANNGLSLSASMFSNMLAYGIIPFSACTALPIYIDNDASVNISTRSITLANGNKPAEPACSISGNYTATAQKGTDPGCGGAPAVVFRWYGNTPLGEAYSSAGCDGGVFIYNLTGR